MENTLTIQNNNLLKPPGVGDIIEGEIISKGGSAVYIDLGAFGTGIIYGRELAEAKGFLKDKKVGEKISAKVVDVENDEGYIELSVKQASKEITWVMLKQKKEKDETINVKIIGANKGGLLAEISEIPAFLPVSQLSSQNYPRVEGADKSKILKELQKFIGQEMKVRIFDIQPEENKLILSEKAEEMSKLKEIIKSYQVGDIVEGEVNGIIDFGIFIKFRKSATENVLSPVESEAQSKEPEPVPFLEGLCHISELDWQIITDPSQVVKVGEKIKAKIIKIEDSRIFLSLKALKEDPWKSVEEKYKKGDVVNGKVIKFNPFGVFVEVAPKIQGLVHISEFGTKTQMEEKLKIGEKYDFQILELNSSEHRMILKLVKESTT